MSGISPEISENFSGIVGDYRKLQHDIVNCETAQWHNNILIHDTRSARLLHNDPTIMTDAPFEYKYLRNDIFDRYNYGNISHSLHVQIICICIAIFEYVHVPSNIASTGTSSTAHRYAVCIPAGRYQVLYANMQTAYPQAYSNTTVCIAIQTLFLNTMYAC